MLACFKLSMCLILQEPHVMCLLVAQFVIHLDRFCVITLSHVLRWVLVLATSLAVWRASLYLHLHPDFVASLFTV